MPLSSVRFCPRLGEHVELRADRERGGGFYLVIGVRQILEDRGRRAGGVVLDGIVIDVKPHDSLELESSAGAEALLEEFEALPVPPEGPPN